MTRSFTQTFWQYRATNPDLFSSVYHWMNLLEGVAWCIFGALVAMRFARNRRSAWEPIYATAFLAFGLSDFLEAYRLRPLLILAKGFILVGLIGLRRQIMARYYPGSRIY
ncbi:MAG: hypothetical protein K1X74_01730 [Pirellulales bacterium]|nr:hypothetical protein [Pirellulales bacterium]